MTPVKKSNTILKEIKIIIFDGISKKDYIINMPSRALRPCRVPGCPNLVSSGYCPAHISNQQQETKARFSILDRKKTPEQIQFYRSKLWTEVSRLHRTNEPLCRECKANGRIVTATLVHHEPDLQTLLERGLNPFNDKYLVSLCESCHQKELRRKRKG